MSLRGPVLVAINFSDASDEALRQGHAIATALGARLVAGHVLPEAFRIRVLFPHQAGFDAAQQTELEEKARAATRDRVEAVLGSVHGCAIEIDSGTAHAGLLAIADRVGAALIVAGPGPTTQRVARTCLANVLTARRSPADGAVLGATDFSDPSLPAVRMAADEATRRGTALRVIHCLDLDPNWNLAPVAAPGMVAATLLPQDVIDQFRHERPPAVGSGASCHRAHGRGHGDSPVAGTRHRRSRRAGRDGFDSDGDTRPHRSVTARARQCR